jgi:hypothetical protein
VHRHLEPSGGLPRQAKPHLRSSPKKRVNLPCLDL